MKHLMKKPTPFRIFSGLAASIILFAFTLDFGGEVYEVYLNDKLMIQQAVHGKYDVPKLLLEKNGSARISINYVNCGQIDTERKVSIRSDKNEILKEFAFKNVSGSENKRMDFMVKDLLTISDHGKLNLLLVYSSKQIEKRSIASVSFNKDPKNPSR